MLNIMIPFQTGQVMGMLNRIDRLPLKEILTYAMPYLLEKTNVSMIIRQYLWSTLGNHWCQRIKVTTYKKIMALSGDFHENERSSDPSDLMLRLDGFEHLMTDVLFMAAPSLLDLALSVHALHCHFGAGLAIYYAATAAIYLWCSRRLFAQHESQLRLILDSRTHERHILRESISNWPTVACFNRFLHERCCFSKAVEASLDCKLREIVLSARDIIIMDAIFTTTSIAAFTAQRSRPVGDFIIIWTWWTRLSTTLRSLTSGVSGLKRYIVKLEPVVEVLQRQPSVLIEKDAPVLSVNCGDIKFENVTFSYDGRQPILDGVSLHIRGGQTTAIVGLSGSGKSTIFKLLLRLFDPQSGSVQVDGYDISKIHLGSLRDSVAVVHQNPGFFTSSITENIRYAKADINDSEIYATCKAAEIHSQITECEAGYDTLVQRMSVGQQQRVAIARALTRDAKIFLLDEPTSCLDNNTAAQVWRNLREHTKEKTVIMITHQLRVAKDAEHIIVMWNGKVIEEGTHETLLDRKGRYWEMWSEESISTVSLH